MKSINALNNIISLKKNQPSFVPKFVQLRNSYSECGGQKSQCPKRFWVPLLAPIKLGKRNAPWKKESNIPSKRKVVEGDTQAHKTPSNDFPYVENVVLQGEQKILSRNEGAVCNIEYPNYLRLTL